MSQPQRFSEDLQQRRALESRISAALFEVVSVDGWKRVELRAAVCLNDYQLRVAAVMNDRSTYVPDVTAIDPDVIQRIGKALVELRQQFFQPGIGTWFSMRLCLDSPETYSTAYNFHHEPEWGQVPSAQEYLLDFEAFPRDPYNLPQWLRERLDEAQPGRWANGGIVHSGPMTVEDQSELADEITALLVEYLPPGYRMFNLDYHSVGSFVDMTSSVRDIFRKRTPWTPPEKLLELMSRLREGMYQQGQGTWFGARLRFDYIARLDIQFNWSKEPEWGGIAPSQDSYREELERFPRNPDFVPTWLEQKSSQTGPVMRFAEPHDGTIPIPAYPLGFPTWVGRPQLSEDERSAVLAYLEDAPIVLSWAGFDPDMLEPDRPHPIPREFRTDGAWIWPAAVAYYLREHGSAPQRQFVDHIRALGYRVPDVSDASQAAAVTTIERDWKR